MTANIGGHLAIESLQDKTHYDSAQQSLGGSVSVGFGVPGGSLSYAKSKVNSDFLSVGEQSGLLAGDGGFDIRVAGDTTLKGGVITSTEAALQAQNNWFETGGKLAMSDLHNHAEYDASSVSVSVGTSISSSGAWTPSGSGMGFGNDSGSADSETRSGISGIAGNQNARTGDAQTGLKPIFDADKVQQDIDAQTLITQSFGQQASKAVGDYAASKVSEAIQLRREAAMADKANDHDKAALLDQQAAKLEGLWGDNGTARIGLHTAIGGLSGGVAGAAGSMAGTVTVTEAAALLESAGITAKNNPVLYNSVVGLAGTAAGALVGGVTGAGTAFNEANNNYLTHQQISQLAKKVADCRSKHDSACVSKAIADATKWSDTNSAAMRACSTRACLDRHLKAIEEAWTVYGLIKNLAQGGADVATLAFGNSKTPNEPDFRYYLDVIRQNPSLQTPFEKKFYAMDAAKRAGFEKSAFGHPLSEKERYALLTGAGGNPIQGVLADAAENYAKGLDLDKQQLAILAVAVGSIKAIKGGSPIPVPNAVLAANGLMYKSNSKHTLGMEGNRPSAGVEPSNSLALFGTSVSSGKKQYAIDEVGNIHQFSYTNDGTWHWSGRSGLDQPK